MAPRFVFRAGPTPFSIKLAVALAVAFQFGAVRTVVPAPLKVVSNPLIVAPELAWIVLVAWGVFATLRLSRWPLLVLTLLAAACAAWGASQQTVGVSSEGAVLFGCMLATWFFSMILILPHWGRLNWRPSGRLPTVADVAENFI